MKRIINLISLSLLLFTVAGCSLFFNPYPNLQTSKIQIGNSFLNYYFLPGKANASQNLVIYLEGSVKTSVLGKREFRGWTEVDMVYILKKYFPDNYDVLVPEKIMNIEMGEDFSAQKNKFDNYTKEAIISNSVTVIDTFLAKNHSYIKIVLMGFSEGGTVLPAIYNRLKYKALITGLILGSSGGLSQFEEFKIFQTSPLVDNRFKKELANLDAVHKEILAHPDSIEKQVYGWPYKRWSGFVDYRPLDDLKKIDVPILLMHDDLDTSCPVESARVINEEFKRLQKKNLSYKEYKGYDHGFNGDIDLVINEIKNWLKE